MKNIFIIYDEDIQYLARQKLNRELTAHELEFVQSGIESGLELWEEVVIAALDELESYSSRRA